MNKEFIRTWSLVGACFIISLGYVNTVNAAAVTVATNRPCVIQISGEIDSKTPDQLINQINTLKPGCKNKQFPSIYDISVWFDSPGGDVSAAISMGDLIRASKIVTNVARPPANASCASACVIAFLGGVDRRVSGRIGLHRPFPIDPLKAVEQANARRNNINQQLSRYFERMGIPLRLLEEINAIPPGDIRWIDFRNALELEKLYITGEDPAWADERDSLRAKRLGISIKEYYARQQKMKVLCGIGRKQRQINEECALKKRSNALPMEEDSSEEDCLIREGLYPSDAYGKVVMKCARDVMKGLR